MESSSDSTAKPTVLLVGHSYGGSVITNAAAEAGNVKALVYVDAYTMRRRWVRPADRSIGSTSALDAPAGTLLDTVPYANAPAGAMDLYLKKDIFPDCGVRAVGYTS